MRRQDLSRKDLRQTIEVAAVDELDFRRRVPSQQRPHQPQKHPASPPGGVDIEPVQPATESALQGALQYLPELTERWQVHVDARRQVEQDGELALVRRVVSVVRQLPVHLPAHQLARPHQRGLHDFTCAARVLLDVGVNHGAPVFVARGGPRARRGQRQKSQSPLLFRARLRTQTRRSPLLGRVPRVEQARGVTFAHLRRHARLARQTVVVQPAFDSVRRVLQQQLLGLRSAETSRLGEAPHEPVVSKRGRQVAHLPHELPHDHGVPPGLFLRQRLDGRGGHRGAGRGAETSG